MTNAPGKTQCIDQRKLIENIVIYLRYVTSNTNKQFFPWPEISRRNYVDVSMYIYINIHIYMYIYILYIDVYT